MSYRFAPGRVPTDDLTQAHVNPRLMILTMGTSETSFGTEVEEFVTATSLLGIIGSC